MNRMDREKVIKGLECCNQVEEGCEVCPYYNDFNGCMLELREDALALLKEQEAVIRCKDCKHYNIIGCSKGFGWCERYDIGHADDWFCADGERKD